jgi:hypothetical protein
VITKSTRVARQRQDFKNYSVAGNRMDLPKTTAAASNRNAVKTSSAAAGNTIDSQQSTTAATNREDVEKCAAAGGKRMDVQKCTVASANTGDVYNGTAVAARKRIQLQALQHLQTRRTSEIAPLQHITESTSKKSSAAAELHNCKCYKKIEDEGAAAITKQKWGRRHRP